MSLLFPLPKKVKVYFTHHFISSAAYELLEMAVEFRLAQFDREGKCAKEILCDDHSQNLIGIYTLKVLKVHYKTQHTNKLAILASNLKSNIKINEQRKISRIYSPLDIFKIDGEDIYSVNSSAEIDFHDQEVVKFWLQTTENVKISSEINVHFMFWKKK